MRRPDISPTRSTAALRLIDAELSAVTDALATGQAATIAQTAAALADAQRVFVLGAGRSGLALRMTGMRLMHLGLTVSRALPPVLGHGVGLCRYR